MKTRKVNFNVRTSEFTKLVLRKASKKLDIPETKIVENLILNQFPDLVAEVKKETLKWN